MGKHLHLLAAEMALSYIVFLTIPSLSMEHSYMDSRKQVSTGTIRAVLQSNSSTSFRVPTETVTEQTLRVPDLSWWSATIGIWFY